MLLFLSLISAACKSSDKKPTINSTLESSGEPESYSATVIRTIEEGDRREVTTTRIARLNEMYREEWTEAGERRAIIFRLDLGKSFLLSLDRKLYVESVMDDQQLSFENESEAKQKADQIDRAFEAPPLPVESDTRALPDQAIDGHACQVIERREKFADGSVEVTRSYHARELAGLALRVEQESQSPLGRTRVVTERRDVRMDAARDEFDIPSDFTKVDSLRLNQKR